MSVNKYTPHIFVLLEDDANRQIANGFILDPNINNRSIQILPPSGGWRKVIDDFKDVHVPELNEYGDRMLVMIIDFDRQFKERLGLLKEKIPSTLTDRVFILGVLSEPEDLKTNIRKNFEHIGKTLSQECVDNTRDLWGHDLLTHNETELNRMISSVKPFLFNL